MRRQLAETGWSVRYCDVPAIPAQAAVTRFLALNGALTNSRRKLPGDRFWKERFLSRRIWFQTTLSSIGDAVIATDDRVS